MRAQRRSERVHATRAHADAVEAQLAPQEVTLKYADQDNDGAVDDDFEKRIRLSELLLKERELESKEREGMAKAQAQAAPPSIPQ